MKRPLAKRIMSTEAMFTGTWDESEKGCFGCGLYGNFNDIERLIALILSVKRNTDEHNHHHDSDSRRGQNRRD